MKIPLSRLQKAFARRGIAVERVSHSYVVRRGDDSARILLPPDFELEGRAVSQLLDFAAVGWPDRPRPVRCACATPDFHPGSLAPVGSVVATDADVVIPAAIGTDINCGMRLITTGLTLTQMASHEARWTRVLTERLLHTRTDAPVPARAFRALFDDSPLACLRALGRSGVWAGTDFARLEREVRACVALDTLRADSVHAPDFLVNGQDQVRSPDLGTIGSGNHFVELQIVDAILDRQVAYTAGLRAGDVVAMIHSGSRGIGFHVGRRWIDKAKSAWPAGTSHPTSGLYALRGPAAEDYFQAMGTAARYAWLNRVVLAEWVREALEATVGAGSSRLVVDVPHNIITKEHGLHIHRKGSTPAHDGQWALLPGSMGDASYLVTGLGHPEWLWSCSHGAGRRVRRHSVRRHSSHTAAKTTEWHCHTLREERRLEEHPDAYKPIGPVIESQAEAGLIRAAIRFRPWRTFKA
ncbi:RtcB family protein [Tahibacter amnicola]|uniref:tRNA-splicing ligase RtcB n=1 Tax=Tahibacter amnicola TaxID=2976241 RepID=A0ABY6BBK1_9GAMM|nr:RtcB family protein [Tahibacter amnicola]UXI67431.1 RtcB family protein [Tahibacter amnicola]